VHARDDALSNSCFFRRCHDLSLVFHLNTGNGRESKL
jgi:hypothetical protein